LLNVALSTNKPNQLLVISKLKDVFATLSPFLKFPPRTNINIDNRVIDINEIVDGIKTSNKSKIPRD